MNGQETNKTLHPATYAVLKHFRYGHLRPELQTISKPFYDLAWRTAMYDGPEATVAIRKLLEAKDAAVRAAVDTFGLD